MKRILLPILASAFVLTAYDSRNVEIAKGQGDSRDVPDKRFVNGLPGAAYYRVGNSNNTLTFWHPFEKDGGGADYSGIFLQLGMELMEESLDSNGNPTFSFVLKNSGWNGIVNDPVCNSTAVGECPDVICLGTTQVAARVVKGELFSLNTFFQQYATENGEIFTDNIFQKFYYDFNYKSEWMGIPLQTDARMFFYNITTFNRLGLKHPPPVGDWGRNYKDTWTWRAMLDIATEIKRAGYANGFEFYGGWDEEIKFITMLAREYKATLLDENGKCGLNTTNFKTMIQQILRPLYTGSSPIANTDFESFDTPAVISWRNNATLGSPLGQPHSCCREGPQTTESMRLSYLVFSPGNLYDAVNNPTGTIGRAFVPGKATFLGGNGLTITLKSKNKDLAWKYLLKLTNTVNVVKLNKYSSSLPPYYTAAKEYNSSLGTYAIFRDQVTIY
jgi:ABC-type glycerol-3-phosphate transport system substrate-binding protein